MDTYNTNHQYHNANERIIKVIIHSGQSQRNHEMHYSIVLLPEVLYIWLIYLTHIFQLKKNQQIFWIILEGRII